MLHKWLVILHVLGATIWVGGHLILSVRLLPESLRKKDPDTIKAFEQKYEPIGIPSLVLQVITGVWMALHSYNSNLIGFANGIDTAISVKLILLLTIVLLAIHARFFILPKLSAGNLVLLAGYIIMVTLISVVLLYLGVSIRFGGIQ